MIRDEIVEEVRKVRLQIEKERKRKGQSFAEYVLELQKKYPGKLVNRGPHRLYRSAGEANTRKVAEPATAWTTSKKKKRRKSS